ncbi:MAG TPA: prolyl oligopeptidase family serine peptidase [Bryobacteraceae bacterium]|jgi:cephalosporin-C deacetylase-like acetyl esterase|nr:prolyl oligopeptidase family serine peptidase [Bryobacteraceae bacterium]
MKFAFAALAFVVQASAADPPSLDYDKSRPLAIEEREVAIRDGVRISLFSYASPKGGRADGMLVRPVKVEGKTGAIIWTHSSGYFNQLSDAVLMAHDGAVSLLVDPTGGTQSAEAARDAEVQTIVDIRRAVDILAARPDVDPHRIAFVGHSYGAMMGAVTAAVDKRFKAAVFEVGLLGMSIHIRTSPHPWAAGVRKELGDKLEDFLRVIEPLDATHFVGHLAPTTLLFQSAHLDPGVPDADAQNFFDAASEPKQLKWYDTGHEVLDIQAISDRARFLSTQLNLPSIEPILKAKIGAK